MAAAGFGGDDGLVVGPHVGAGQPNGTSRVVALGISDDGGQIAGCLTL